MILRDVKAGTQFQVKIALADGVEVLCNYHKGPKHQDGKYLVTLFSVLLSLNGIAVSNHKTGGAITWMDERMTVC